MPQTKDKLVAITKILFPLTTLEAKEKFKAFVLTAFDPQEKNLDVNDFAGVLLILTDPNDADECCKLLPDLLTASQMSELINILIVHEAQALYADPTSFLRQNGMLTKLFKLEFEHYTDDFFILFAVEFLKPLIKYITNRLSQNLSYKWDEAFEHYMIERLPKMITFICNEMFLTKIHPIFRANCHSLYSYLHLYSPFPVEKEYYNEELENEILVKIGGYFFLRYFIPAITRFTHTGFFTQILKDEPLITELTTKLQTAPDEIFGPLVKQCVNNSDRLFSKLGKMAAADRKEKNNNHYLRSLASILVKEKVQEILVNALGTPLMKLVNCVNPQLRKNTSPWVNGRESWNTRLMTLFLPTERTEVSDWFKKIEQFLKRLTQKITPKFNDQFLMTGTCVSSIICHSPLDTRIQSLISSMDPYQSWRPNHPFLYAVATQNQRKASWLLTKMPVDILRAIEIAYKIQTRLKAIIYLDLIQQAPKEVPASDLKTSFNDIPIYGNNFDRRSKNHYITQIILTKMDLLVDILKAFCEGKFPLSLYAEHFILKLQPNKTQDTLKTADDALPLPEQAIQQLVQSLAQKLTNAEHSKWQWFFYSKKTTQFQSKQIHFENTKAIDIVDLLECVFRNLWKDKRDEIPIENNDEQILNLALMNDKKLVCELDINQILTVINDLFNQHQPDEHKLNQNEIKNLLYRSYLELITNQEKIKSIVEINLLPLNYCLTLQVCPHSQESKLDITGTLSQLIAMFHNKQFRNIQFCRESLSDVEARSILTYATKMLGLPENYDQTIANDGCELTFLDTLLIYLIQTPLEQPLFILEYPSKVDAYKNDQFIRTLTCCRYLRDFLSEQDQNKIISLFKAAYESDFLFVYKLYRNICQTLKMTPAIGIKDPSEWHKELYEFFKQHFKKLEPIVPLRLGMQRPLTKQPLLQSILSDQKPKLDSTKQCQLSFNPG